ncbi:MAG: hypothetical protein QXE75_02495 [Sulfolobales archaeon]
MAAEGLARALSEYFRRRGPLVAGYIELTGQPDVKVSLRAIAPHYEGTKELPYLEDALKALDKERLLKYLEEKVGWRTVCVEGEEYVSIPSRQYVSYVSVSQDFFKNLLEQYCSTQR